MAYPSNRTWNSMELGPRWAVFSPAGVTVPWLGQATLNAGSLSVTVSNTNVASTAVIAVLGVSANSAGVGLLAQPVVTAVVHGVSFNLARVASLAATTTDTITWEIRPTLAP